MNRLLVEDYARSIVPEDQLNHDTSIHALVSRGETVFV